MSVKKIIHIDADCFYAAIEMRDDPNLRDRPVAVGGHSDRRGVISTCNYDARRYGVRSAMSSSEAMRLCPSLIIVPGNMAKYREASMIMRDIFYDYTELVEPLSLDEAYLDVSECERCKGSATLIAEEIRQRIYRALNITVSAGVAPNKFLAKIASDWNKPNGIYVIPPKAVSEFVKSLPVGKIHGVGKVTNKRLNGMGIQLCKDVLSFSLADLTQSLGTFGVRLEQLARGVDPREVKPHRTRKSMSVEHTFAEDLPRVEACIERLPNLLVELRGRLNKIQADYKVSKAFVKVKFNDFTSTTVERVGTGVRISDYQSMMEEAVERKTLPVRLMGIGVRFTELSEAFFQFDLFDELEKETRALAAKASDESHASRNVSNLAD